MEFVPTEEGTFELVAVAGSVRHLKGAVASAGYPVSLEDMDEAIAAAASGAEE